MEKLREIGIEFGNGSCERFVETKDTDGRTLLEFDSSLTPDASWHEQRTRTRRKKVSQDRNSTAR